MDKVFEKTRELGEALLESEAYTRMKAAEENPDPAAMKRLSDEMDELNEKLQMIDDIAELTQARSEFNGLIGQINQVLQFIVTGRMDDGSECSGSCESCRGCH